MNTVDALAMGLTFGAAVPVFGALAWWSIRDAYQRYTDRQVREAKKELREYVRDREGR